MGFADKIRSLATPLTQRAQQPATQPAQAKKPYTPPHTADSFSPASSSNTSAPVALTGKTTAKTDVTVKPDELSGSAKLNGEVKGPKGISVSIEASAQASVKSNVESKDGYTTYTVTADASVTVGGKVDAGVVGFGANHTEGVTSTYEVRMSDEDYRRMEAGEIPEPSPYDPDTMPAGSSIIMKSSDYTENGFSASYKKIQLDSKVKESEGVSTVIEKGEGNELTVTSGPTEAIENSWKLGLSLGPASVHVGNTTELEGFTLHTATFDLDSDEGVGAYGEFLVTGDMPKDNGPGITDAAKIEKIDYSSTSSAGFDLGPFGGSVEIGSSSLNQVSTTLPDGSRTVVSDFSLHPGDIPIHLERSFKPDGTEDLSKQQFTMNLKDVNDDIGAYLYTAFTGESDYETAKAKFKGDKDFLLTMTADDVEGISDRAQDFIKDYEKQTGQDWDQSFHSGTFDLIDKLAKADNAADVALIIGKVFGGEGVVAEGFLQLMFGYGRDSTPKSLPGTVEVK